MKLQSQWSIETTLSEDIKRVFEEADWLDDLIIQREKFKEMAK